MTVSEIEKNVRNGNRPEIKSEVRDRFRDVKQLIEMIERAWLQDPAQRPGFMEISQMLNDECSQLQGQARSVNTTASNSFEDYSRSQTFSRNETKSPSQSAQVARDATQVVEPREDAPTIVVEYDGKSETVPRRDEASAIISQYDEKEDENKDSDVSKTLY